MFMGRVEVYSKFKTYLVGYRDIPAEVEEDICRNSIMVVTKPINVSQDNQKSCCGLNTRICIYLQWFKDEINEALKDGYTLALIEVRKSQKVFPEIPIKGLIDNHCANIKVLGMQEL